MWKGIAAAYDVWIDEVKVGRAPRGKTTQFEVDPGTHALQIKSGIGTNSDVVTIEVDRDRIRSFICYESGGSFTSGFNSLRGIRPIALVEV